MRERGREGEKEREREDENHDGEEMKYNILITFLARKRINVIKQDNFINYSRLQLDGKYYHFPVPKVTL